MNPYKLDTYPDDAAYYADQTRVSASMLKVFARSPATYHARFVAQTIPQQATTDRLQLGTAAHCAILEPGRFESAYAVAPKVDRRTREGKAAWAAVEAECAGRILLTAEQMQAVRGMQRAVAACPLAMRLIDAVPRKVEQSVTWLDPETGLACKGKPDVWQEFDETIIDLKTVTDCTREDFIRSIARYGYGLQLAHYLAGTGCKRFVWVTVDTSPPHQTTLIELSTDSATRLRGCYEDAMRRLAECYDTGDWKLYPTEIDVIDLPAWVA